MVVTNKSVEQFSMKVSIFVLNVLVYAILTYWAHSSEKHIKRALSGSGLVSFFMAFLGVIFVKSS